MRHDLGPQIAMSTIVAAVPTMLTGTNQSSRCSIELPASASTGTREANARIKTVPRTCGVTSRRRYDSLSPITTWNSPETTTSAASVAGPPLASARMQNGKLTKSTVAT